MKENKVRKFLGRQIAQLNDIVADMDGLVSELGMGFYRVCIFGSARIKEDSPEYLQVKELANALAAQGCDIVTGGGPGLMEAANVGAQAGQNKTRSIGLPIELPFESDANSHLDVKYHHQRFSSRLDEFMRISHAVVITPGGIGTLLELLFTWQLLQVKHIEPKPVVLLGTDLWGGFLDWMKEGPLKQNLMNESDFNFINVVDSVDEVLEILQPGIKDFRAQNDSHAHLKK